MKYFKLLKLKMGDSFDHAVNATEECFEDVWYEFDFEETGFITWHQMKPFIARIAVHEAELAEERRLAEEERQHQIAEAKRKAEEEEEARRLEEERLAKEGEEDD